MCETSEYCLAVPADLVKETVGLSIDIGGSMMKVVYRSKENLKEANNATSKTGHLQVLCVPKSDLESILDYLKQKCAITRSEGHVPEVQSTGYWCKLYEKTLRENLDIRLKNLSEFECFFNGFTYFASRQSRKEFLHPYDDEASEEPVKVTKALMDVVTAFRCNENPETIKSNMDYTAGLGKVVNDSDEPIADCEDIYPCILVICGSAFGYMLIQKDKTYKMIDGIQRGGKSFYGIGYLLTGCKSFDELIELAEVGDTKYIDWYSDSILEDENGSDGNADVYETLSKASASIPIYNFGKVDPSKPSTYFRREDLARSWLKYFAQETAHCLTLLAEVHHVKRIFICGSFCNTSIVRNVFTSELVTRNLFNNSAGLSSKQFDFVKAGPYMGVLGALVSG